MPAQPRQYATRNQNAQEAHEAIRPAGKAWRSPEATDLKGDELALYTLVYQRTVASQMHDALYDKTVIRLQCGAATLMAQGRVLRSAGYTQLLADEDDEKDNQRLPALQAGQMYPLKMRPLEGKKTSAPSRYTEATLVQAMEKAGIGRPSTYASTLATLQSRDYARLEGRALAVTATGLLVAAYLARQLPQVTAQGFTAEMEAGLDAVAAGELSRLDYLTRFWTQGLQPHIAHAQRDAPRLSLPHLDGTVLQAHQGGAQLLRQGQRSAFPAQVIPADLTAAVADQILAGTWSAGKPARRRKSAPKDDSQPRPERIARPASRKAPKDPGSPGTRPKKAV